MKLGKVIGTLVATHKDPSFEGVKLLVVQPLDEYRANAGEPLVACDAVQSGTGDIVMYEGGREAAIALANWFNPSDATIFGIVDRVDLAVDSPKAESRMSNSGSGETEGSTT